MYLLFESFSMVTIAFFINFSFNFFVFSNALVCLTNCMTFDISSFVISAFLYSRFLIWGHTFLSSKAYNKGRVYIPCLISLPMGFPSISSLET